jgi:hypothetical protein
LDRLGKAGSAYRTQLYNQPFSGSKQAIALTEIKQCFDLSLRFLEHTIDANKRPDHLYHAYNLMTVNGNDAISIAHLSEMLEGQVAALSSGYLSAQEALMLLDGLRQSKLFRPDQYSYLLYPNKNLPGFLEKNNIPAQAVGQSALLTQLVSDGHVEIIEKDVDGVHHFNSNFKNANDLSAALNELSKTAYAPLVEKDQKQVLQMFEDLFNHKAFTGRSGTFFGYEGLGSIYWHMVSKLLLAAQECCLKAAAEGESPELIGKLLEHYYEINEGIGVHKSPSLYGAFPTDPYSHTPAGKGAQQPGMTGQVKEDILSRFGELGVFVKNGQLNFNPCLLRKSDFLEGPGTFEYVDVHQEHRQIPLEKGSLSFTYCQVPIVYTMASENKLTIVHQDHTTSILNDLIVDKINSQKVFERTGEIIRLHVHINSATLK